MPSDFYPTYEELKPFSVMLPVESIFNFYPTYEELKHRIEKWLGKRRWIFTLPMRNWNISEEQKQILRERIFTLPMRNWNPLQNLFCLPLLWYFYPTYEELKQQKKNWQEINFLDFYPTYEELKLLLFTLTLAPAPIFLPYLWGIETLFRLCFPVLRL